MIKLSFPEPDFRVKKEGDKDYIFDVLRKRWIFLTPEEWVRQNIVRYLTGVMHYPASMIAVEKEIRLGELRKRFDILVYDGHHQPWMMIECKEMNVRLDDAVLRQVLRYNIAMPVRHILITNGSYTHGWQRKEGKLESLEAFPPWSSIAS